jgi:hypothetical protein
MVCIVVLEKLIVSQPVKSLPVVSTSAFQMVVRVPLVLGGGSSGRTRHYLGILIITFVAL